MSVKDNATPTVIVDENFHRLDMLHHRLIYCHVVASDEAIANFLHWHEASFLPDTLRYKSKVKVHFTDEDTATKQQLVEMVKNLEVTIKFYITYLNSAITASDKQAALQASIEQQLQNDKNSRFIIEESSSDYDVFQARPNIQVVSSKESPETALADICLGVMARKLSGEADATNNRWYQMLYPRIRLQVITDFDGSVRRLTRVNKLQ